MTKRGSSNGTLVSHEKYVRPKPEFSLTEKELPEIKSWNVGKKYTITIKAEMVSQSKGDQWETDNKDEVNARFKVISATTDEEKKD